MPCDSVRTVGVNLNLADAATLSRALDRLGVRRDQWSGAQVFTHNGRHYTVEDGQVKGVYSSMQGERITPQDLEDAAKAVRVAYAEEVVADMSERYGWAVEQTDAQGNETVAYVVTKETF